jgi:hypothetical protein
MAPFAAGLNNQRLAIAGLVVTAAEQRRALALPGLVDYVAGQDGHDPCRFEDVFDVAAFGQMLGRAGIEAQGAEDAVVLSPRRMFMRAAREISHRRRTGTDGRHPVVHAAIAALRPRRDLARLAEAILLSARSDGATIGCQLRLERDWQAYIDRSLRARVPAYEDVELDHNRIFQKIVNTFGPGPTLYVTCDETALYLPREVIAGDAGARFGIRILWKSSMPSAAGLATAIERSAVDFEVALGFDRFVGSTRSTFFNMLTYTKSFFEVAPGWAHYPYNLRADALVARKDNGAFSDVRLAIATDGVPEEGQQEADVEAPPPPDERIAAFFRTRKNTPRGGWTDRLLIENPRIPAAMTMDLVGPTNIAVDKQLSYLRVLAGLHGELRPDVYVEIGVNAGGSLKLAAAARLAVGVDPEPVRLGAEFDAAPFRIARKTSDAFFEEESGWLAGEGGVDLAFLDGLHVFEFVLRDFIGVERVSRPKAVTAIHDVLPRTLAEASRHRITRSWTGDVWRLLAVLERFRPDLAVTVLDAFPTGLALVSELDPDNLTLAERYDEVVAYGLGLNALDFLYRGAALRVRPARDWLRLPPPEPAGAASPPREAGAQGAAVLKI